MTSSAGVPGVPVAHRSEHAHRGCDAGGIFYTLHLVAPQATVIPPTLRESAFGGSALDCVTQPHSEGVWKGGVQTAVRGPSGTAWRQAVLQCRKHPLPADLWDAPFHTPAEGGCDTQSNGDPSRVDSGNNGRFAVAWGATPGIFVKTPSTTPTRGGAPGGLSWVFMWHKNPLRDVWGLPLGDRPRMGFCHIIQWRTCQS